METQSAFMAAAAAAFLLVAALARRRDAASLRFAGLCAVFGLWAAARGAEGLGAGSASALRGLALAFLPPFALSFAAGVEHSGARGRSARALAWAAAPALALALPALEPRWRALALAGLSCWALLGVALAGPPLWRAHAALVPSDPPEASRVRYLANAHAWWIAGALADVGLALAGHPRVAALLLGALFLYVGWLVLARVRIPDLRLLFGNALALGVLSALLAASFAALHVVVGARVDLFLLNAFVASFLLLVCYEPARDAIRHVLERRFAAGKVRLERALRPLSERLQQVLSLEAVLSELIATLELTDRVTASAIFLRDDSFAGFRLAASSDAGRRVRLEAARAPAFVEALAAGEPLLAEELEVAVADARSEARRARLAELVGALRELGAGLVLPLRSGRGVVGFWTFSHAARSEPFASGEVELLRRVADRAARSIETSRTFEDLRARDRLVSLGEMAAGLAHEIRNPLAAIRGALAVLEEADEWPRSELSDVIVQEVQRLDRVVGMFLEYGRPATHRAPIPDFGGFVRGCVEAVARRHARDAIALELEIPADLPVVCADRSQLETVLANVVQNAYEAVRAQPAGAGRRAAIRVRARAEPASAGARSVEIEVADSGPGMDEATLARAFVPFFTTKERGLGLGLALVERLTRAQGGAIQLRSKPGDGTTVTLRLPAGAEAEEAA